MPLAQSSVCQPQCVDPQSPFSLQAVIFDVDGTLANTERDGHRVAFNRAFIQFGLDWHWSVDTYGELLAVTGGKERIRHYAARHVPQWLAQRHIDAELARLHALKNEIYRGLVADGAIHLRTGVARLIRELQTSGVRLAIATTTTLSSLQKLLSTCFGTQATMLFEVIGAGDVVVRKKPAPDIYWWVLDRLGLEPTACLAIEDSRPGLAAALAAGLPTLVTTSEYTLTDDFAGAVSVVSDLGEPEAPPRQLGGQALESVCVDLAQLRLWHRQALHRPPPASSPRH